SRCCTSQRSGCARALRVGRRQPAGTSWLPPFLEQPQLKCPDGGAHVPPLGGRESVQQVPDCLDGGHFRSSDGAQALVVRLLSTTSTQRTRRVRHGELPPGKKRLERPGPPHSGLHARMPTMPVAGHTLREAATFETVEHGRCSIRAMLALRTQVLFCKPRPIAQVVQYVQCVSSVVPNGYTVRRSASPFWLHTTPERELWHVET